MVRLLLLFCMCLCSYSSSFSLLCYFLTLVSNFAFAAALSFSALALDSLFAPLPPALALLSTLPASAVSLPSTSASVFTRPVSVVSISTFLLSLSLCLFLLFPCCNFRFDFGCALPFGFGKHCFRGRLRSRQEGGSRACPSSLGFYSSMFIVQKVSGVWCQIIDLSILN